LDHEIKEKGENLSSGTAQLLCLARVLLKRPKLLFMDEATASVDAETDKLVQETIRREGVLPLDCSIVTIAHRLHTVIDYDRIVVLSAGEVVENAHPADLLANNTGHLSKLVDSTGRASSIELRRRSSSSLDLKAPPKSRAPPELPTKASVELQVKETRAPSVEPRGNALAGCFVTPSQARVTPCQARGRSVGGCFVGICNARE